MIGNLIVMLYLEFRNIPFGSAVAIVLLLIVLAGLALYMRALRTVEEKRS
jgi:spermidine/putrescine transport system permease protein